MTIENDKTLDGSRLMKAVEAIAISPEDAREIVEQYAKQAIAQKPDLPTNEILEIVTNKIISRYTKYATTVGASTALPGVVPGVGTAIAATGVLADVSLSLKIQIDMTMCLAIAINGKLSNEDAKYMSYIIALAGSLEKAGVASATKLGTKASVQMINIYLKGSALTTIKELFKKVGINFTKKAATKIIPFGIGVVIGGTANYALTRYVGKKAKETLMLTVDD